MKQKRSSQRKIQAASPPVLRWRMPEIENVRPLLVFGTSAFSLLAVLVITLGGLERLRAHVYSLPENVPSVKVDLADPPSWVNREGWKPRILSAITLPNDHDASESQVVEEIYRQMAESGWVSQVHRVVQSKDGTVRVWCDYRRPIAMLRVGDVFIPVDEAGVRLPEEYPAVDKDAGWLCVTGIESAPPAIGKPFEGADAVAAVRLAALISQQEPTFLARIWQIDVRNFNGRDDPRRNHVYLRTRAGGVIKWGSAIGEEHEENSVKEKLEHIAQSFKRSSPQAQVDVSVHHAYFSERSQPDIRTIGWPTRGTDK